MTSQCEVHIEVNQYEYHPDALCEVHDRELKLYVSQFFISEDESLKVDLRYHFSRTSNFEHIW